MYLSRLILNTKNPIARRDLTYPYELHRTVFSGFPKDIGQAGERVLYRLDGLDGAGNGTLVLLVQSTAEPDWSHLGSGERAGYLLPVERCPDGVERNPAVMPVDPLFRTGQVLAFRLRANPTVKKDREGKEQGRREGILREEDQLEWLRRKAEKGGFAVLFVQTSPQGLEAINGGRGAGPRGAKMIAVRFDGLLRVSDPEAFRETLIHGIGSGKGFGFGLLSLARPAG